VGFFLSEEDRQLAERVRAVSPKWTGALHRLVALGSWFLVLLPAALALLYIRAFGVSVVFADAWSMVTLFGRWSSGTLRVSKLYALHNEHRMLFPKGAELLLGTITNYNNLAEMYLVWVCFLVTLAVLLLAFRHPARRPWLLLFVPVSLLVFGLRQYENLLFGFQINFAFTQTFGVLALFLLYVLTRGGRFEKLAFAAALGSATVASFSTAQGLLVWPAGLVGLLVGPAQRPAKTALAAVWGLVGLTEWIAYFAGYAAPKGRPSMLYALDHPVAGVKYFLTLLGGSLFWRQTPAFAAGLLVACLVLAALLLIYKSGKVNEYSFWVSLLVYSLLMLAVITLGRVGLFGAEQALSSRYAAFSVLAVVSIYAVLAKTVLEGTSVTVTALLAVLSGAILLSAAISYPEGVKEGAEQRVFREEAAFVLATYETQPDWTLEAHLLHPSAELVRRRAPILQRLGYNVFSEPRAGGLPPPLSSLSPLESSTRVGATVNGVEMGGQKRTVLVPRGTPSVAVVGWAVDTRNASPAGGVYVDVDGRLYPAFYGTDREGAAGSPGPASYRYSGFERAIPVSEIGAGAHELSIVVLTSDGKSYYRNDLGTILEVR